MPESRKGGEISARFSCNEGITRLSDLFCRAPLKIAKTFPQSDGSLQVCTMDCSPGLLAGDRYRFDWHLEAGARVHLTNQSFTRVHPSRERPCTQEQRVFVGEGACLDWFPEPTMLFSEAHFESHTTIELEAGATLLFCEILCAGRVGRGEAFAFHQFQNRLRVTYDGQLAFLSQTRLTPGDGNLRTRGAWGDYTHWGTFLVCGETATPALRETLLETLAGFERVQAGISQTAQRSIAIAMLGHRAFDLQAAATTLRNVVRNPQTVAV